MRSRFSYFPPDVNQKFKELLHEYKKEVFRAEHDPKSGPLTSVWQAVYRTRTPINVFALAMSANDYLRIDGTVPAVPR